MPIRSRWTIDIPNCSLPAWFFQGPQASLPGTTPCYHDAEHPDTLSFTRASFTLWCQRLAVGLQQSPGFRPGDRVLVFSPNDIFYPVLFMGIVSAGAIFTGANPAYKPRELAHQLKDSGARYLFCAEAALDTAVEAARLSSLPQSRIFVFSHANLLNDVFPSTVRGIKHWSSLLASSSIAADHSLASSKTDPDSILALNYSSGTTGLPKGVCITHRNYIASISQILHHAQLHSNFQGINARTKFLCFLPMYHATAQAIMIVYAWMRNVPVYIMATFSLPQVLRNIERYKITNFALVPPIAVAVAKSSIVENYDLSSIEMLSCGSAPLGRDVCEQIERRWKARYGKDVNVKQGWGMTETTCAMMGHHPESFAATNSVGELYASCEAMLVDDYGVEMGERGEQTRGELWVRGPNIMMGYWNREDATKDTLTPDAWLKTGDIAWADEKGEFFIVDRKKELIKVRGNQVAPAELEALLLEHKGVADSAVIGTDSGEGSESVKVFVVRAESENGRNLKGHDLVELVRTNTARHKWITGGVEFVDAIPKNASGKILRRLLREKAMERVKALKASL